MRHLPPVATPLGWQNWQKGLRPGRNPIQQFQAQLSHTFNTPCLTAASGRTVLFLLLTTLKQTSGRTDIILPAYTCPALAKVILDAGLRPVLVDVSPDTLAVDPQQLAPLLTSNTLALIHVHPFGLPHPIAPTLTLAHNVGALIIEDAAQSMGAKLGQRWVGTQGDFGLFSLGPGKPLAVGGGGILLVNNATYLPAIQQVWAQLEAARSLPAGLRLLATNLAFTPAGWWLATKANLQKIGNNQASWGYRLRQLSPLQAAIGHSLLNQMDSINHQRQSNAAQLIPHLNDMARPPFPNTSPIHLRLPLLAHSPTHREQLHQALWANGIGVGRLYPHTIAHLFPTLATAPYPGASHIAQHLLTLPTHHHLTKKDLTAINTAVRSFH